MERTTDNKIDTIEADKLIDKLKNDIDLLTESLRMNSEELKEINVTLNRILNRLRA